MFAFLKRFFRRSVPGHEMTWPQIRIDLEAIRREWIGLEMAVGPKGMGRIEKEKSVKQKDVTIGKVYAVKVSGVLSPVRLVRESPYGGWEGVNERTGKAVRIKTAAKLRREMADKRPEAKKPTMPRRGKVTEVSSNGLTVTDENGKNTFFVRGSIHFPGVLPVGTEGVIQYIIGSSHSLDFFTPDGAKEVVAKPNLVRAKNLSKGEVQAKRPEGSRPQRMDARIAGGQDVITARMAEGPGAI